MDDAPETLDDLAAHAHETHVVVVGGGIGGLVAALECAKIGMRVTVVEASDRLGGALSDRRRSAGLAVDVGAEGYRHARRSSARASSRNSASADAIVAPDPRAEWIAGLPGGAAALPAEGRSAASPRTRGTRASAGSSAGAARGARTSTGCARR